MTADLYPPTHARWRARLPSGFAVMALGLALALLPGCGKPVGLTETVVAAESVEGLAAFRAELGRQYPAGELEALDVALQELRLEALNQDISPASAREEYVRAAVHGQTIATVRTRGWEARRTRLQAEIKYLTGLLEHDLARQQKTPTENISSRIASAREVLGRLERDLAGTEAILAGWNHPPQ